MSLLYLVVVLSLFSVMGARAENTFSIKDNDGNTVMLKYEPVGCFKDNSGDRALRNDYFHVDRSKLDDIATIRACAEHAYKKGYKTMFGIQYYAECWSDVSAEVRYNKYDASANCENGIGKGWANFVYHLSVVPKSPVKCLINGKEYNEGEVMEISTDWAEAPYNSKCKKCKCVGGKAEDCVDLYFCELGFGPVCQKYKNVPDKCCPVCDCYHDSAIMPTGSSWLSREGDACSECNCVAKTGYNVASCSPRKKCDLCFGEEQPNPGKCCPKCVPKTTAQPTAEVFTILPETERPPPVFPPFPPPPA